jgi:hypothetical protein
MSTTGSAARVLRQFDPATVPTPSVERGTAPRLRIVRSPQTDRSRLPFALLCFGLVCAAMVGVLVLNIQMARDSFAASDVQRQVAQTAQEAQRIQSRLDTSSSPSHLAAQARSLGMKAQGVQGFLNISDHTITGTGVGGGNG